MGGEPEELCRLQRGSRGESKKRKRKRKGADEKQKNKNSVEVEEEKAKTTRMYNEEAVPRREQRR
jgi:hypothetical protein